MISTASNLTLQYNLLAILPPSLQEGDNPPQRQLEISTDQSIHGVIERSKDSKRSQAKILETHVETAGPTCLVNFKLITHNN